MMNHESEGNLLLTFGCAPAGYVDAKSTIATAYFRHLRRSSEVKDGNGRLKIPGALTFFGGGRVETTFKGTKEITLRWSDRVQNDGIDRFATGSHFFNAAAAGADLLIARESSSD